jgi:hypothetical protein
MVIMRAGLLWSIWFIWLVSSTKKPDKPDEPDRPEQPDEPAVSYWLELSDELTKDLR